MPAVLYFDGKGIVVYYSGVADMFLRLRQAMPKLEIPLGLKSFGSGVSEPIALGENITLDWSLFKGLLFGPPLNLFLFLTVSVESYKIYLRSVPVLKIEECFSTAFSISLSYRSS